jgi:hypothetical protein
VQSDENMAGQMAGDITRPNTHKAKGVIATAALAGVCLAVTFVPSAAIVGLLLVAPLGVLVVATCCNCASTEGDWHED